MIIPAVRLLPHVVEAAGHPDELGAAAEDAVRVLNQVASELIDAGQLDTSRPLLDLAAAMAVTHLESDHPRTLTTRSYLARWLGEAVTQFRQLLDDYLRALGPDHPATLTTRGYLAYWLGESGRPGEAVTQFRQLLIARNLDDAAAWLKPNGMVDSRTVDQEERPFRLSL